MHCHTFLSTIDNESILWITAWSTNKNNQVDAVICEREVWKLNILMQNSASPPSHDNLPSATAAVCKYSSHQQSRCWRGPSRAAWGRESAWWIADPPRRAADRWKLWRAGSLLSAGQLWIKCGALSHVVTYASLVHDHHLSISIVSLALPLTRFHTHSHIIGIMLLWF